MFKSHHIFFSTLTELLFLNLFILWEKYYFVKGFFLPPVPQVFMWPFLPHLCCFQLGLQKVRSDCQGRQTPLSINPSSIFFLQPLISAFTNVKIVLCEGIQVDSSFFSGGIKTISTSFLKHYCKEMWKLLKILFLFFFGMVRGRVNFSVLVYILVPVSVTWD